MSEKDPALTVEEEALHHDQRVEALVQQCMREIVEAPKPQFQETPRRVSRLPWIVGIVGFLVIAIQTPALIAALKDTPSLRIGSYETDPLADACLKTLWQLSRLLQESEPLTPAIVEPVTHKPYEVKKIAGEIVVECPNPELHGLTALRISEHAPAPEVIP